MTRDLASTICIGRGEALTIGVRVQSGVARLHGTLAAPRANSGRPVRLVLLPDGPDEEMIGVLRGMRESQLPTPQERGAGDCLARLVAAAETPIVAFLESGALVGPGWLDRLLAALEREPAAALVGPSTSCGPQAVESDGSATAAAVARVARQVGGRFGDGERGQPGAHQERSAERQSTTWHPRTDRGRSAPRTR